MTIYVNQKIYLVNYFLFIKMRKKMQDPLKQLNV